MEGRPPWPARPLHPASYSLPLLRPHPPQEGPMNTRRCASYFHTQARATVLALVVVVGQHCRSTWSGLSMSACGSTSCSTRSSSSRSTPGRVYASVSRCVAPSLPTTPRVPPSPQLLPHGSTSSVPTRFPYSQSAYNDILFMLARLLQRFVSIALSRDAHPASSGIRMRSTGASGCGCGASQRRMPMCVFSLW